MHCTYKLKPLYIQIRCLARVDAVSPVYYYIPLDCASTVCIQWYRLRILVQFLCPEFKKYLHVLWQATTCWRCNSFIKTKNCLTVRSRPISFSKGKGPTIKILLPGVRLSSLEVGFLVLVFHCVVWIFLSWKMWNIPLYALWDNKAWHTWVSLSCPDNTTVLASRSTLRNPVPKWNLIACG